MTYKCQHCGEAIYEDHPGEWRHPSGEMACSNGRHYLADPAGGPEPLSREQEIAKELIAKWSQEAESMRFRAPNACTEHGEHFINGEAEQADCCAHQLAKAFGLTLPAEPTKS